MTFANPVSKRFGLVSSLFTIPLSATLACEFSFHTNMKKNKQNNYATMGNMCEGRCLHPLVLTRNNCRANEKKHNMFNYSRWSSPFVCFFIFVFFFLFIRFESFSEYSSHVICSLGSRLSSAEREIKTFVCIIIQNDHSHCLWPRPFQRTNRNNPLLNKNEENCSVLKSNFYSWSFTFQCLFSSSFFLSFFRCWRIFTA